MSLVKFLESGGTYEYGGSTYSNDNLNWDTNGLYDWLDTNFKGLKKKDRERINSALSSYHSAFNNNNLKFNADNNQIIDSTSTLSNLSRNESKHKKYDYPGLDEAGNSTVDLVKYDYNGIAAGYILSLMKQVLEKGLEEQRKQEEEQRKQEEEEKKKKENIEGLSVQDFTSRYLQDTGVLRQGFEKLNNENKIKKMKEAINDLNIDYMNQHYYGYDDNFLNSVLNNWNFEEKPDFLNNDNVDDDEYGWTGLVTNDVYNKYLKPKSQTEETEENDISYERKLHECIANLFKIINSYKSNLNS